MSENDIDNKYLAQMLGRQVRYLSQRMTGQRSWTIEEAVQICDLLHIPLEQLPELIVKIASTSFSRIGE